LGGGVGGVLEVKVVVGFCCRVRVPAVKVVHEHWAVAVQAGAGVEVIDGVIDGSCVVGGDDPFGNDGGVGRIQWFTIFTRDLPLARCGSGGGIPR